MKIDKSKASTAAPQVQKAMRTPAAEPAKPVAPADEISLLGVPEADLSPKVRSVLLSLVNDIRELRAELEQTRARVNELEELADRDPMLDIFNRRAFTRELDRALAMIDRYKVSASLIFIDLNDLKKINDNLGHGAGDAALNHVAAMLSANVRQTDVVARLGGDEFAVLLMQADKSVATEKAAAVSALISAQPVQWDGEPFNAAVSWGAVEIKQGVSAQEAMNNADEAMYAAKRDK